MEFKAIPRLLKEIKNVSSTNRGEVEEDEW